MQDDRISALAALGALRASLEAVAGAIQSARLDDLLAAEERLSASLAGMQRVQDVPPAERAAIRTELVRARVALRRCRSLGAGLSHLTDASLAAQGRGGGYGRAGLPTSGSARTVSVHARM